MACYFPKTAFRTPNNRIVWSRSKAGPDAESFQMPCGGCISCRIDKASAWKLRLLHEAKRHETACFITLTVDPKHYPESGFLEPRDAQLFWKRVRKEMAPTPVRHFTVMEYGDRTWRTHLHAIAFGINFTDREFLGRNHRGEPVETSPLLRRLWKMGEVTVGDFTPDRAGYASGYAVKKIGGIRQPEHYRRVHPNTGELVQLRPEWMTCSRNPGLGFDWADQFEADAFPSGFLVEEGRKYPVPEAYKRRWKERDPELADGAILRARDAFRPSEEEAALAAIVTEREAILAELSKRGRDAAELEAMRIAAGELPSLEMRAEHLRYRLQSRMREAGGDDA